MRHEISIKNIFSAKKFLQNAYSLCATPQPSPRLHFQNFFDGSLLLPSEVHFVANCQERSVWHVMTNFRDPGVFDTVERRLICYVKT